MPAIKENFSKIVRSLLLDVDVHLDQLEQVGYLSKEQRAFLDKFLYKSEDALRAVSLRRSSHGSDALVTNLLTEEGSPISRSTAQSLSKLDSAVGLAASRVLPRLRSVTEQLKSEEDGLTTFLQRCSARNFSVKVRGTDIGKESPTKVKGSDYILTLESIAEGSAKSDGSNYIVKPSDPKSLKAVNHDTNMMLHGTGSHTHNMSLESIDCETTLHKDAITSLSPDEAERTINDTAKMEPTRVKSAYREIVEFRDMTDETANIDLSPKPTEVQLAHVDATNLEVSQIELCKAHITKIKLADTNTHNEQMESQNSCQWGVDPSVDATEEIKTNAWGKLIKPDPTQNKEGAIVGDKAKPLGSDNRGRAIMERMGWSKGTGLGKQKRGILEPITHVVKNTKTGLRTSDDKLHQKALNPPFLENKPNSTSDHTAEEKPVNLTAEPREQIAIKVTTEKHKGEPSMAEAATVKTKPESIGIKVFYLGEGENPSLEKTIMLNSRIRATNEIKTTMHSPGVRVKVITPQGSHYSKRIDDSSFKLWTGNVLEILRVHRGDEYHVYSFASRKRGIVKISLVEMMEQPKATPADEKQLPNHSSDSNRVGLIW